MNLHKFPQKFHVSIRISVEIETIDMPHFYLIEIVLYTLPRKLSIISKRCNAFLSCFDTDDFLYDVADFLEIFHAARSLLQFSVPLQQLRWSVSHMDRNIAAHL